MLTRNSKTFAGFTLIELLVVLAVLALLAAILFPVFASVRENARRTQCASNLKQLGLAFQQYSGDNDEQFPLPGSDDEYDMSQLGPFWDLADPADGGGINAYVKSRSSDLRPGSTVWLCPDMSGYHETPIIPSGMTVSFQQVTQRTYTMNWFLRDPAPDASGTHVDPDFVANPDPAHAPGLYKTFGKLRQPLHLNRLTAPSDTVLLFEGVPVQGATYFGSPRRSGDFSFQKGYQADVYAAEAINTSAWDGSRAWHNGRNEMLFCDGHVRAMPVKPYPWVPALGDNVWYVARDR